MDIQDYISEPARDLPVLGEFDVVVCGGGPAGCAAAIAATRHGAKTLLVEKEGFLGGAACSQLVCPILSTNGVDFQGIWHEFICWLQQNDAVRPFLGSAAQGHITSAVDPEQVKFAWDSLLTKTGVEILHHAYAGRCIVEGKAIKGLCLETRAGRQAVLSRLVIDATGDGIVAAQTGAGFDQGDGTNPWAMALTKVFRMGNVKRPAVWPDEDALEKVETELTAAIERGEYDSPVIIEKQRFLGYLRQWLWALPDRRREMLSVISRVLKVNPLDPFDITRAEREGREQARQAADAMRRFAPGFEDAYLLDTSAQIGLRSSRRIHGLTMVSDDDAWNFRKQPDGVARSSWQIDVWPADSYDKPAVPHDKADYQWRLERMRQGDFFDIPYGCLVARDVSNLFMAGRCISAGHLAESSLRIQQTCMATGQAAGTAAALCIQTGLPPDKLDRQMLVNILAKDREAQEYRGSFWKNYSKKAKP